MNFLLSPIKGALGVASALALGVFMTSAGLTEPQPELAIGSKAPLADVLMMNVNGTQMSLNTAAGPNGLLVVFSCNTCPFVVGNGEKSDGWEGRYNETAIFAKENGVSMVLVNSNEAKRDNHDSMDAMKVHARTNNYGMPYLLDANHQLADAFGAYGKVEKASIISDRNSGRSKGFGFVTMEDADEANKAIEAMNGSDMGGRSLKVNEARPREDRPPRQSNW